MIEEVVGDTSRARGRSDCTISRVECTPLEGARAAMSLGTALEIESAGPC
jgi:hypothetical protein